MCTCPTCFLITSVEKPDNVIRVEAKQSVGGGIGWVARWPNVLSSIDTIHCHDPSLPVVPNMVLELVSQVLATLQGPLIDSIKMPNDEQCHASHPIIIKALGFIIPMIMWKVCKFPTKRKIREFLKILLQYIYFFMGIIIFIEMASKDNLSILLIINCIIHGDIQFSAHLNN